MKTYSTEQEAFWAGQFGDEYIQRNVGTSLLASNIHFFSRAFQHAGKINSLLEFGANVGMNLKAIQTLLPGCLLRGIEINEAAVYQLSEVIGKENVMHSSILDVDDTLFQVDVTMVKGVLIHINPDSLTTVYEKLYNMSAKYILIAEYYNPVPVEIAYRGFTNRLFKRDFAGEFLQCFPDCELVDYGFSYRRDPKYPQDDITWFLIKK